MTMAGISSSSSREELQCQPAGYPTRSAVGGQPTFFVSKERRHESSEHTHGAHEASRSGPLAGSNWHQVAPSSKFQHTKWGRRRRKDHKRPSSSFLFSCLPSEGIGGSSHSTWFERPYVCTYITGHERAHIRIIRTMCSMGDKRRELRRLESRDDCHFRVL